MFKEMRDREMADAALESLSEKLKELQLYNADLIMDVQGHVERLERDLSTLKDSIEHFTATGGEQRVAKKLMRDFRDATLEAEDVIDLFVVMAAVQKARTKIQKMIHTFDYVAKVRSAARMVETVRERVKTIYDYERRSFGDLGSSSGAAMEMTALVVEDPDNVVGFDDEATMLIRRLTGKAEHLQVISIIGMGGLGKTTLAKMVCSDPRVISGFSIHAWTYLSRNYSRKDVFLFILNHFIKDTGDMSSRSDERLAEEIRRQLTRKYIVVVDDVWEEKDWDDIKMVFPDLKNGSRVLLTSRNRNVAIHADPYSPPHELRFLDRAESLKLFQKKFSGQGKCPTELEPVGEEIAAKCDGLPLAVEVVAGMLVNAPQHWWERAAESSEPFNFRDADDCMEVLALSYYHLPPQLKACFLYFGVFPEDYDIPVWKLIRLWIAERFFKKIENVCLEDIAEEHLEDLVARNLVLVVQRNSSDRIKTCRIHRMFRNLCLREALAENFFLDMRGLGTYSSVFPLVSKLDRRLFIHSRILDYIALKPYDPFVRTFLCFASKVMNLSIEDLAYLPRFFKLLRVFEIQSIHYPQFPIEILQLVHLRYIAISGNITILPASMSNLWNLETLIVETTSSTIDIQADIWNMLQLRHMHTTGASQLHGPILKKHKDRESSLQTLSTITPQSCTENILGRTRCIRKLGIRGKLAVLVEEKAGTSLFDNLTKLEHLVTLKLLNDVSPRPPSESKLHGLPRWHKFPRNLKRLTLADTFLDWEHMSVLGMLLLLEVLKLKDNAFTGTRWTPHAGGFRQLKVLKIGKTDLVHWVATRYHFPRLQHIVLRDCGSLEAIPSGLAYVETLQTMMLYQSSNSAAASAGQILEQQKESNVYNGLEVHVFP